MQGRKSLARGPSHPCIPTAPPLRPVSAVSTLAWSLPASPRGEVAQQTHLLPPCLAGGTSLLLATPGVVLEPICEWFWGLQAEPLLLCSPHEPPEQTVCPAA